MAFSSKILLTLATVLVLATSQAHGLTIGGVSVNALGVNVNLNCPSVTGTATPLANLPVTLFLNSILPIASATTDLNGNALLNVNSGAFLAAISNTLSNLQVRANLPIPACPLLATVPGVLQGALQTVGTVLNGALNATAPTLTIRAS